MCKNSQTFSRICRFSQSWLKWKIQCHLQIHSTQSIQSLFTATHPSPQHSRHVTTLICPRCLKFDSVAISKALMPSETRALNSPSEMASNSSQSTQPLNVMTFNVRPKAVLGVFIPLLSEAQRHSVSELSMIIILQSHEQ